MVAKPGNSKITHNNPDTIVIICSTIPRNSTWFTELVKMQLLIVILKEKSCCASTMARYREKIFLSHETDLVLMVHVGTSRSYWKLGWTIHRKRTHSIFTIPLSRPCKYLRAKPLSSNSWRERAFLWRPRFSSPSKEQRTWRERVFEKTELINHERSSVTKKKKKERKGMITILNSSILFPVVSKPAQKLDKYT